MGNAYPKTTAKRRLELKSIRTLLNWYQADAVVETRLPELAAYLGHVHVRDSYWYLSAVPKLLQLATLRLERAGKGDA